MMETLKNFLVGFLVLVLAFIICSIAFLMWPFMLGAGSLISFIAVIVLAVVLLFYIVVFIGYVVRKSLVDKDRGLKK